MKTGKILVFLIVFFNLSAIFAQQNSQQLSQQQHAQPWWLTLEQGKLKFRSGDYGYALMQFEDARRQRHAMYEQMEKDLIHLLSHRDVRRIGDALDRVERYSRDMHYTRATAALEELYYRVPKKDLNNSAARALEALGKLKDYPEAEYWIGEIYRVEGEFSLALTQYRRAYSMRGLAEDPGFGIALQYRIGSILFTQQDYNEMERAYLSVINEYDTLWINARGADATRAENARIEAAGSRTAPVPYAQASASFASSAMGRTLENDGIGRFLELYRYNNITVEQAHRQLGFFYSSTGRPTAQQHLMYAFLIQNTVIIEEITRRQFDFTLADPNPGRRPQPSARELLLIAAEINKNPALARYAEEIDYYKTAYYLGLNLYRNGKANIARNFWEFLAAVPEAGEWHDRSVQQLRGYRPEPVNQMP
ncbi:MAG: hypothetical protein LBU88_02490 [Treponema sp.]|jgi:tetratricopeptide (TPR) repeat protein|nr:hypothetical protein [Treponema sp.]